MFNICQFMELHSRTESHLVDLRSPVKAENCQYEVEVEEVRKVPGSECWHGETREDSYDDYFMKVSNATIV